VDELAKWTSAVCSDLGVDEAELDRSLVLDIARNVRRTITGPAAPVTAYLVGIAVGQGLPPSEAVARLGVLTNRWRGIDWSD
jgi:hypothetical protein